MSKCAGYEKSAHLYDLFDRKENVDFFYSLVATPRLALSAASRRTRRERRVPGKAGEILDIGAGTGRIAIRLARRGIEICCVEPSPAMRGELEKKLQEEPELRSRITQVDGDAVSFELGRTFPAAILSGSFDHLLDDDERLSALGNIRRHLAGGGVLIFDVFLGLMGDSPLVPAGVAQAGARQIHRFVGGRVLPGKRKETLLIFEVYEGDKLVERIEERSLVGITSREDTHRLLTASGFEVYQEWSSYDFKSFQAGDPLLIVEAHCISSKTRGWRCEKSPAR